MRYRILGPIQVRDQEGGWRYVPGPLSRGLLAELLAQPELPRYRGPTG